MTSKSPARSCEDVDDSTLSYAEIKALCAGNPLIKEKMDLDIEVGKLRVLRSEHQNQLYRLEDSVNKLIPKDIERTKNLIENMKVDIEALKNHPLTGENKFAPMTISGRIYHEKHDAGKALLAHCNQNSKAGAASKGSIGEYRGFKFSIDYNQYTDSWKLLLNGKGSYSVELGIDPLGNVTRINNLLANLPTRLQEQQEQLTRLETQLIDAKAELEKPFKREKEYQAKTARLATVTSELELTDLEGENKAEIPIKESPRTVSSKPWQRGLMDRLQEKKEIASAQSQSPTVTRNNEKMR